jgi:hypothetical protein
MPVFAVLELTDFLLIALIVLFLAGGTHAVARFWEEKDEMRLRRLERKLDLLLQHAALPAEAREELRQINAELQVRPIPQQPADTVGRG